MRTLIAAFCIATILLYAWTGNAVVLVPLIAAFIALAASDLKSRLKASARLAEADVKRAQFTFVVPCFGVLFLAAGIYSFLASGLTWDAVVLTCGGPYCLAL